MTKRNAIRSAEPETMIVTIESLAFGGEGIARRSDPPDAPSDGAAGGGKVCFVPGALPGERVLVRRSRARARYDRMELLEVLEPSPHRRAPLCPHTDVCGGCSLQTLEYAEQLAAKATQVRDLLARIAGLTVPEPTPPLASPRVVRYRNKMEFTFAPRAWHAAGPPLEPAPGPALGLHVPGRFDAVFDLEACVLASESAVAACLETQTFARELGLEAYRSREDTGLLRHLILREGANTGEVLVALVVREDDERLTALGPRLAARIEGLVGLVSIVNDRKATVARGERERLLWGRNYFTERLGSLDFRLQAQSFFQTNTLGAESLVSVLKKLLAGRRGGRLLDLYCGAGALGLLLADQFEEVIGVEQIESAVQDAESNSTRNGITHARFLRADVETWLQGDEAAALLPCGVIVDPPRAGLHPKALQALRRFRPPWIAYVSCNPSTLARDAAGLIEEGYVAEQLQIIDLFPHTAHVESVVLFSLDSAA